MSWRTQRIRLAAASGWSPNSCAIRPAQPPIPNCWTARPIAVATMSAVGASDGCSAEENRAWQRAPFIFIWVKPICVAAGISHHPVLVVLFRVRLWAEIAWRQRLAGRRLRPRPVLPVGGGPDDYGSPGPAHAALLILLGR